jgi:hypothetical protein
MLPPYTSTIFLAIERPMPVSEPLPRLKSFLRGAVDAEVAVAQVVLLEYVATCTHAPFLRDILRAFACATVQPRITRAWIAIVISFRFPILAISPGTGYALRAAPLKIAVVS